MRPAVRKWDSQPVGMKEDSVGVQKATAPLLFYLGMKEVGARMNSSQSLHGKECFQAVELCRAQGGVQLQCFERPLFSPGRRASWNVVL